MGKPSESIFDGKTCVIPMADVQHVEKQFLEDRLVGYAVITNHTKRNSDYWENHICLGLEEGRDFLSAWCHYRYEIEFIANARLIVAAPELLEACIRLTSYGLTDDSRARYLKDALKAIAKATDGEVLA